MSLKKEVEQFLKEKYSLSDFNAYQRSAARTAIYPHQHKILYPALGLAGEAGEVANKVKKLIRDGEDVEGFELKKIAIASEIGDVLWYCAMMAKEVGVPLNTIMQENLSKLHSRKERGTLQGSGDDR